VDLSYSLSTMYVASAVSCLFVR